MVTTETTGMAGNTFSTLREKKWLTPKPSSTGTSTIWTMEIIIDKKETWIHAPAKSQVKAGVTMGPTRSLPSSSIPTGLRRP